MDEEKDTSLDKVWHYLSKIKSNLENNNRFFTDADFVKKLKEIFGEKTSHIRKGTKLYRGRIYTEENKYYKMRNPSKYPSLPFQGYDEEKSFVNFSSQWSAPGRMNPEGVFCLYTAKDIGTCIVELHPGRSEPVSIAEIEVLEDLKISDLSDSFSPQDYEKRFSKYLSVYVQEMITQGGNSQRDYVFPQFIAECCKHFEYDGIAYRSKYYSRDDIFEGKGINLAIFNYNKCKAVSSRLYSIKKVSLEYEAIGSAD